MAPLTDRYGAITTNKFKTSLILNESFSSVFTKENTNSISHPEPVFTGDTKEHLLDVDVSQSIVENKLKNFNKNKVPGVNGIHPSLLRELSKQLSGPLSILFRRTLGVAPIFSGLVDMDPPLGPGGRRTYDLCGTCKRTMDNEVPGFMY